MPLRLPPLSSLRLFEAAGRHLSFKFAAAELNVTPSAVSHGIVGLEQTLGVDLFIREPRGLSLTPDGADYLAYVQEALSLIAIGTQRLPAKGARRAIAVSSAPTFAARWLLPRLRGFSDKWPDVSLTIDTSRRRVDFPVDGFDFAIRMSRAPTSGLAWTRLIGEELAPVCSPATRARLMTADGAIDLRRATLIHLVTVSEDWRAWLDARGMEDFEIEGGLRFDTAELAFEAAIAGLGVALGRKPLVDRDLASGALVEIGGEAFAAESAYWLVSAEGADRRPDLASFKRWLIEETQAAQA